MPPTTAYTVARAPGALPLAGHVGPLLRDPFAFLADLPRHGDLVEIRLGRTPAYVPCHPQLLWDVLTHDRLFDKGGPFYERVRGMAGNGLASCPHAHHRRQRRLMQSAFHPAQLRAYATVMAEEIDGLIRPWGPEQVIDVYPTLYRMALRTATRTLFAQPAAAALADEVRHSFEIAFSGVFRQMFMPPALIRLPLPGNVRHRRAVARLRHTVDRIVAGYRSDPNAPENPADLLGVALAARDDEGLAMTDTEVRDQVVNFLAGGTETVAATLTWALQLLAAHPEQQRTLQAEADAALGGRAAHGDDLPRLEYANRVVQETVRLHPPAWMFTRGTAFATELAGLRLPPGSTVVITPVPTHRSAALYDRPDAFDPDRWTPDRAARLPRGAYVGFGAGARKCIGDAFGTTECVLALATVLSRWDVTPVPGADLRPYPLAAFHRPRRLSLRLTRRGPAGA
ncbi:cytochrome P450 [Streptomyces sp. G45]|uniref:cytochrome P450 n=1 Tax=Streptomyces sp. G45 TaxID=3406627 RepID=UPI003C169C11